MHDRETLSALLTGITRNIAYNLEFIAQDKLRWKPAPEANSAFEIVDHVIGALGALTGQPSREPVANVSEAAQKLEQETHRFTSALRHATVEELEKPTGSMQLPMGQFAALLVVDTINHHGQITFIQTLLGDTQSHFAPDVLSYFA